MFIEFSRRVLTAPGRWSVAGQTFALQVLIAVLVVVAGLAGAYGQAQRAGDQEATARALAVAETMAATPDVIAGVQGPEPSAVLQPYAERVRVESGTDFVVVMSRDAIRYTHPDPTQIGKKFLGHTEGALAGGVVEENYTGTLGPSSRVVVPVTDQGKVVALVSVGIRKSAVGERVRAQLPVLLLAGLVARCSRRVIDVARSRRLPPQTHGDAATRRAASMYEYYEAVLHAVAEGLVLHDRSTGTAVLANDAATPSCSACPRRACERPRRFPSPSSAAARPDGRAHRTEPTRRRRCAITPTRVLVINRDVTGPRAERSGRLLGTVATLRDHTELQALTGELGLGPTPHRGAALAGPRVGEPAAHDRRPHRARPAAPSRRCSRPPSSPSAQALADRVVAAVDEPVLAALLLGKTAQANERGIAFEIELPDRLESTSVPPRDLITIVGNLIDNALASPSSSRPCGSGCSPTVPTATR